jgi:photosystem II stability/assembly factor-like uncharacterized protein
VAVALAAVLAAVVAPLPWSVAASADVPAPAPATGPGWRTTSVAPSTAAAVSCADASHCMAVGPNGLALSSSDGGASWVPHRVTQARASLGAVSCPTATTCVATLLRPGRRAEVARTTDFGETWALTPSGLNDSPSGISCVTATRCWAAGQDKTEPEIAVTTDGVAWHIIDLPEGLVEEGEEFDGYLTSISCPSLTHCAAVGALEIPGGHTILMVTTDDGVHWEDHPITRELSVLRSVSCATATRCTAVGVRLFAPDPDDVDVAVATTDWDDWSALDLPMGLPTLDGVSCPVAGGGDRCVAVAGGTGVVTTDGGATWTPHPVLTGVGTGSGGVSCPTASACVAAAGAAGTGGPLAHSADGGATWQQADVPGGVAPFHGIECLDAATCLAAGTGGVARTTDGAASWATALVTTVPLLEVSCAGAARCWAVGEGGVLSTSTDAGATWTPGTLPGGLSPTRLSGVDCPAADRCVAGWVTPSGAGMLVSTDGASWQQATVPASLDYVGRVSCADASRCVAVSSDPVTGAAAALVSGDGGLTWTTSDLPDGGGWFTSAAACGDATHCYAAAFDIASRARLFRSVDGGASWTQVATPSVVVADLGCTAATRCWAAQAERGAHAPGGVLATVDGAGWVAQPLPGDAGLGAVALSCAGGWCRAVTQGSEPGGAARGAAVVSLSTTATASFATATYQDFLGRAPSGAERDLVAAALDAAPSTRPAFLSRLSSGEAWATQVVRTLYQQALGRAGDPGGVAYWATRIGSGATSVATVAAQLYASNESYTRLGGGTVGGWVDSLYDRLLHRAPDAGGRAYWIGQVAAHGRVSVAGRFFQSAESARTRVRTLYQALLGRDPDPSGLAYWSARVVRLGDLALAAQLAASSEYFVRAQQRFP